MFSRKILWLTHSVLQPFVSRSYRNVKVKQTHKSRYDNVKGNPGGNRVIAMVLDGESPDKSNIALEDLEDGEDDLLDSHLLYDQHKK